MHETYRSYDMKFAKCFFLHSFSCNCAKLRGFYQRIFKDDVCFYVICNIDLKSKITSSMTQQKKCASSPRSVIDDLQEEQNIWSVYEYSNVNHFTATTIWINI